ncbi:pF49L [African swine fever virus]|nr:pF49L [African swine fever virus]WNK21983.1 pF49L [African swine fever virus]WNK22148.1 pF49L [African swine fever virus]WNL53148.1 pF49L [African swine fever virus]WRY69322.1 pF49L [African swine fever virus]
MELMDACLLFLFIILLLGFAIWSPLLFYRETPTEDTPRSPHYTLSQSFL